MNVRGFKRHFLFALPVGLLALTSAANATTISGLVNVTGSVTVTNTSVLFSPVITPNGAATGSFSGFSGGTIKTLTGPPFVGPISVPQFATFNVAGVSPVFFDLQTVLPGSGTPAGCAPGAPSSVACTPAGSPFTLTYTPGVGVSATIAILGIGYTGTAASGFTPTQGLFTAQFIFGGPDIATLLSQIAAGNYSNTSNVSFSATFAAMPNPVPEPSAASLLFAGAALIAGSRVIRRYRQQS